MFKLRIIDQPFDRCHAYFRFNALSNAPLDHVQYIIDSGQCCAHFAGGDVQINHLSSTRELNKHDDYDNEEY